MKMVLDCTRLSAAYGTRLLAEAGHRVVRVEPATGDDVRRTGPFLGGHADLEHGAGHHYLNAGKESTTINPATPDGEAALRALVARADCVVVTRPFPFEAEWFLEANPRIVAVFIDDVDTEICAFARSGLMSLTGHPEEPPSLLGGRASYGIIGLYVALAVAAGFQARQLSGEGQHIEVSAQACLASVAEQALLTWHTTGEAPLRRGFRGAITAVSGAFMCADGYWMISVPHEPVGWNRLMEWVADPVLMADPTLVDESARQKKRDFILDRLADWSRQHSKEELVTNAQQRHIPASPVASVAELATDPQLIARKFLQEMDHPEFGPILFPMGATTRLLKGDDLSPAPRLGAHNKSLLEEIGYSPRDIRALLESGAA